MLVIREELQNWEFMKFRAERIAQDINKEDVYNTKT